MAEEMQTAKNSFSTKESRMLGFGLHSWEEFMLLALGLAAFAAVAIIVTSFAVVRLTRAANEETKREFEEYKLEAGKEIGAAKVAAATANKFAAKLNNETARLQADNLSLQTVLLPRNAGLVGLDQEPPAKKWFAGFEQFAGTKVLIQTVPGDPEAKNLANEIAIILSQFGWHPEFIDDKRSGVSLNLREGLSVASPGSFKAWDPKDAEQQVFTRLHNAATAAAHHRPRMTTS